MKPLHVVRVASTIGAALTIGAFVTTPLLSHERVNTTVTYDREIVRILKAKCVACHSANNLGIPLTTYEETRPWARAIEEELLRRHMPPWRAAAGYGEFANDLALTNRELQLFIAWVEGNGPRTKTERLIVNLDRKQTPAAERLTPDFTRWELGTPDLLQPLARQSIAVGDGDAVRRVVVDLGLTSEQWVRALEFKPGDRRVVRAAFFSLQETGQWLGSWTPWHGATTLPDKTAYRLPAGAHVVADVYYRSTTAPVDERGTLGLYLAKEPAAVSPSDVVVSGREDASSKAVATESRTKYSGSVNLPVDMQVLALKPDLRAGIDSIQVTALKPDGVVQVLLLVRDPLPAWPTPYIFKTPIQLPKGTRVSVTYYCTRGTGSTPLPAAFTLTASVSVRHS